MQIGPPGATCTCVMKTAHERQFTDSWVQAVVCKPAQTSTLQEAREMAASDAPHEYQRAAREMKAWVHTMAAQEGGEGPQFCEDALLVLQGRVRKRQCIKRQTSSVQMGHATCGATAGCHT